MFNIPYPTNVCQKLLSSSFEFSKTCLLLFWRHIFEDIFHTWFLGGIIGREATALVRIMDLKFSFKWKFPITTWVGIPRPEFMLK